MQYLNTAKRVQFSPICGKIKISGDEKADIIFLEALKGATKPNGHYVA